jgi:hypothetical protein
MTSLPNYKNFTNASISSEGLNQLKQLAQTSQYPGHHTMWTDDYKVELPIRLATEGIASTKPTTIVE